MAIATNTRKFELTDARSEAQTTHQSREHVTTRNGSVTTDTDTDTEFAIHACQRRAREQVRRAKQHARYRDHKATVVQRSATDDRSAEADVRDRQGEVV